MQAVITSGSPDEIAALVRATQERRGADLETLDYLVARKEAMAKLHSEETEPPLAK